MKKIPLILLRKDALGMHNTYAIKKIVFNLKQNTQSTTINWYMYNANEVQIFYLLKWYRKGRGTCTTSIKNEAFFFHNFLVYPININRNEAFFFHNFLVYPITVLIITTVYGKKTPLKLHANGVKKSKIGIYCLYLFLSSSLLFF